MPDGRVGRWAKRALIAAAVALAPVAAGNAWVLSASRGKLVDSVEAAPARPWIIVLGNKVFPGGQPSRELAERLEIARALYQAGRAPRIVVSGLVRDGYDEPSAMADWLRARGVPADHIAIDAGGHRTAATMANAAARGVRASLIATQGYHLPRSLYLAHHAGIDAVGVAARPGRRARWHLIRTYAREIVARAESVFEVLLRGVRA
jgi:vancomycin permeability regulator SanA